MGIGVFGGCFNFGPGRYVRCSSIGFDCGGDLVLGNSLKNDTGRRWSAVVKLNVPLFKGLFEII